MKFFPESTLIQLEFDKIKNHILSYSKHELSKRKIDQLRIHTKIEFIQNDLLQTNEYKLILDGGIYFPNDFINNISKELKLLDIPGAVLSGEQFLLVKKLALNTENVFRWFNEERKIQFPYLSNVIQDLYFEKTIVIEIDKIIDNTGIVKDEASESLKSIRMSLYRKRNELRRVFDKIVSKLNKDGYLADIEESFMNGRRVLAVHAEQKRKVKGILHSESDSKKTSFIEPEETTLLNNEIFSLENDESKEVYRILRQLTQHLSVHAYLLNSYYEAAGMYDFIYAKAAFAKQIDAHMPLVHDKAIVKLYQAYHPLLKIHNQKVQKHTIPLDLVLDENSRVLVISGPNAGGKTVTLKTVGLLQIMLQSGLLLPVSPDSEMGVFKQMMIHIGDTQSIEFELSTYSAHLTHMKYFIENANGKTLFFIDELGSGSDPNLGGAFAEVIMEELSKKQSFGIVTTHYLNLKIMANKVKGIINGAMQFDEKKLLPLYQLKVGAPGSSYTFSIAERIGLDKNLIVKAKKLVDQNHFQLDRLLNSTEQDFNSIKQEKKKLQILINENEALKKEMELVIQKEKHLQEVERIKLNNKILEDKIIYLKEMERKLKSLLSEWRKTEDKASVIKTIQSLLYNQKEYVVKKNKDDLSKEKYVEISGDVQIGDTVRMKKNKQTALVKEIRGKKALLQVGTVPMLVSISDLVMIKEKE